MFFKKILFSIRLNRFEVFKRYPSAYCLYKVDISFVATLKNI